MSDTAIVRVGDGRGFVVESGDWRVGRIVITAAHCLPRLPPPMTISHAHERTYANLLGPIGREPTLWAECLYVDPVNDTAVLCGPDGQALYDQREAFDAFVEDGVEPMRLASALPTGTTIPAKLYALDQHWFECEAALGGYALTLAKRQERVEGGMSGSPIVDATGAVIGIVTTDHWPNPRLPHTLPFWLVEQMNAPPHPVHTLTHP